MADVWEGSIMVMAVQKRSTQGDRFHLLLEIEHRDLPSTAETKLKKAEERHQRTDTNKPCKPK